MKSGRTSIISTSIFTFVDYEKVKPMRIIQQSLVISEFLIRIALRDQKIV